MSKINFIFISIIVVATVLRFWNLGSIPVSPDWDEASLGYNAYSILTTGKDEYGNFMPVMLKSFGDYKPALYTYIAIPSIELFGLTSFSVRLPSALLGIISVVLTFFLVKELFKNTKLALISAFLLAISPLSIQFSRTAFEANLGVSLNLLTVLFFLKGLKKPKLLMLSALFSGLSLYSYQSEKIFAPIFMLFLILIYRKELLNLGKKYFFTFALIGFLVATPMIFSIFQNTNSLNRARSTSFIIDSKFSPHTAERVALDRENSDYIGLALDNRRVAYVRQSVGAYLSHFDLNWLFVSGDLPRHHAPFMGLLYLWELPFLLIGIYVLIFDHKATKKVKLLIFSWFLLVPIPASITNDVPHAVRTLNFLPTFQIFVALGLISSVLFISNIKYKIANLPASRQGGQIKYLIFTIYFLFATLNILFYLNQYFVQQNFYNSREWQYGYQEALDYVKNEKGNYKKIIVSNQVPMDQSYIFFLFYLKYPPKDYQKEKVTVENHDFDIFKFRKINWNSDKKLTDTLIIGNPGDFKEDADAIKTIKYPSGEDAIKIVKPLSSTF